MSFIAWCLCFIGGRDRVEAVGAKMGQNDLLDEGTGWNR